MRLICPPHISLILLQLLATCVFSSKPQRHNSYWGSHYPGTPGAGITGRSAVRNPLSPADAYQNSTRVALYLAGQTRTLNRTICSMRQHLIAPLRAQGLAVHIFAVVEADATANAAELLQSLGAAAVHVRLVDPAAVPVPERCMELVTRGFNKGVFRAYGGGYAREYLRKMYYRQQCDEWRQEHDRRPGALGFAWVLFGRFDVVYLHPLFSLRRLSPSYLYSPPWRGYWGLNDEWAVAPPALAVRYAAQYTDLCNGGLAEAMAAARANLNSEQLHWWHLNRRGVPLRCLREPPQRFWFARLRKGHEMPLESDLRLANYYRGRGVCRNEGQMERQLQRRAAQLMCDNAAPDRLVAGNESLAVMEPCVAAPKRRGSVYLDFETVCTNERSRR